MPNLESEQVGHPSSGRHHLTESELNWLEKDGGSSEGIILCLPSIVTPSIPEGIATNDSVKSSPDYAEFRVGQKTDMPPRPYCRAFSLFSQGLRIVTGERWPLFLTANRETQAALVGLHLNDYLNLISVSSLYHESEFRVEAKAFLTIDLMTAKIPSEIEEKLHELYRSKRSNGFLSLPSELREFAIETTLGGMRRLRIAEDWQEKLREARPFEFRKWDEVLDVIEEK